MDAAQRRELIKIHLNDQLEAIDQKIVDIWWKGVPTCTAIALFLTPPNIMYLVLSDGPLRYFSVLALIGIWLVNIAAYRRLFRAVKSYRQTWNRWPKFNGWM